MKKNFSKNFCVQKFKNFVFQNVQLTIVIVITMNENDENIVDNISTKIVNIDKNDNAKK